MKNWIVILALSLSSTLAYAFKATDPGDGEDDGESGKPEVQISCYKAELAVPANIPEEFCFGEALVNMEDRVIQFSDTSESFPSVFVLETANKKAGGQVHFQGTTGLVEQWGAECSSQYSASLRIEGETTWNNDFVPDELVMEVLIERPEDRCSASEAHEVISYRFINNK